MSDIVSIDSHEVDQLLNALSDQDFKNEILFNAVKEGAKVLQENAQNYFKSSVKGANHYSPYIRKPLYEGVSVKADKPYCTVSVSIMNDFRMKFFEKGTAERMTKGRKIVGYINRRRLKREGKGHATGSIKPTYFFRRARENDAPINEAIEQSITQALNKLD